MSRKAKTLGQLFDSALRECEVTRITLLDASDDTCQQAAVKFDNARKNLARYRNLIEAGNDTDKPLKRK